MGTLPLWAVEPRQPILLQFASVRFKHLTPVVEQPRFALGPPVRHGLVFLQLHPEAIGKLSLHDRPPNPRHRLKNLPRTGKIQRDKTTLEPGHHVGPQGDDIGMCDITHHGDFLDGKN